MQSFAPIVIFAFNRPKQLQATLKSLAKNPESEESDLFIFIDGPRKDKAGEKSLVAEVKSVATGATGFKNVMIRESTANKGLGPSIIAGVSDVIAKYGSAIVLEDDLIVQPNFLAFMNLGLTQYKDERKVWSICGYTNKVKAPKDYPYDAYFCTRSSSWGWATWKDRWESVDWSFDHWDEWKTKKKEFVKWGGSDCFSMLESCKEGRNKSWAIRFCFNQFLQNKVSLFPVKSLVMNDGFDGMGTNCKKYSRFKYELMDVSIDHFKLPEEIAVLHSFRNQALHYHSILLRIWSKIMYMIK